MKKILLICCGCLLLASCKKFLDERQDAAMVVPSTLDDIEKMMDHGSVMSFMMADHADGSSDDVYVPATTLATLDQGSYNNYTWGPEYFFDQAQSTWSQAYLVINYTNIVLEKIVEINRTDLNAIQWDRVYATAHFFRAYAYNLLINTFAPAYDPATYNTDMGVCLRLKPDFNVLSVRSSVKECYDQILYDAKEALHGLPVEPVYKTRPGRPAVFALLARIHLTMNDFKKAGDYADSCIRLYPTLLNYNEVSLAQGAGFPMFNGDVIFHAVAGSAPLMYSTRARVDTLLYRSYANDDLRKKFFFNAVTDGQAYTGSYGGTNSYFSGISAPEAYLIKAEALAEQGFYMEGLTALNTLLQKRWKTGTFIPFTASSKEVAIAIIRTERRKEMTFRGIRFFDLKRWNKRGANIVVRRKIGNELLELLPNDLRYAIPIPRRVIDITGMPQNPR
jgi:tetratricopeptide (TPR) repeat protein